MAGRDTDGAVIGFATYPRVAVAPRRLAVKVFDSVQGRVANPAGAPWNMAKTLAQMLVMWSIFFFLAPAGIYSFERRLHLTRYRFRSRRWKVAGVTLFLLGYILAQVSAVFMVVKGHGTPLPADATRQLVVAGPYRFVRNPMAMGSLAQGFAIAMFLGSPLVAVYAFVGSTGWNYLVRPWEEKDLERRFGEPYRHYRDSVRCWIPRLHPYEAKHARDQ
jgi:protein-S-isoprenylcysteine O-methyltransferase Ste14